MASKTVYRDDHLNSNEKRAIASNASVGVAKMIVAHFVSGLPRLFDKAMKDSNNSLAYQDRRNNYR